MPFGEAEGLRFFQFESLADPNLDHAILTRHGGVSPAPWNSLNYGRMVGDDDARVTENIGRGLGATGQALDQAFDVWQVHSATVIRADEPNLASGHLKADAIITDRPDVTLMMRFADCVPIMIYDPRRLAAGVAHAGWLGTVRGVATELVRSMQNEYGCRPEDLIAGIGPSIGPDHYSVGEDVVTQFEEAHGDPARDHLRSIDGAVHLDLWSANEAQLRSAGVCAIEVSEICTACNLQDWYSYRGENGNTGRFGAHLAIRS
ncbi:MAG: peptidoglycan editing factor PgeF [Anaerolineales bacterium]